MPSKQNATLWLVFPCVALLLFPSPWMGLGFVGALAICLVRWALTSSPFPATRANLPILLLLSTATIGFVLSPAPDLAVNSAGQIVASISVFYVLAERLRTPRDLWQGAAAVVLLGVGFALAAPLTVQWTPDKLFDVPVVYGRVGPRMDKVSNSNIVGGALAMIVPMALALVVQRRRSFRLFGAAALVPIVVMLFLLQSRGAWFGLALGLGLWLILHQRWFLPLIILGVVAALAVNVRLGGPSISHLVYGKIGTATGGTLVERQDMWVQSLYLIRQAPVAGIGLGAYPRVAPYTWPYSRQAPGMVQNHTHNLFLQVALDTGILGLASFVVLLAIATRAAVSGYRQGMERSLAIAILAALAVLVVHGFGDVIVWGSAKPSIVLWMILALALGLDQVGHNSPIQV